MTVAPKTFARKYIWFIMTLCLLPWFVVQSQLSINGDTAWLLTAARRLLDGGMMSTDFYETNPPLSVLYHIPPVFLAKILAVPEYTLVFLYFSGLIALSACAVNAVLKSWDFLEAEQRYMIVAAFLAGNTILTSIALGEREHIIFLGLMPFLLAQLSLTWKHPLSRKLLWVLMIFGTFAVLLKPHYGLLPTLLLVHRMIVQKRFWSITRDPDFLSLAIGTLSYIALILVFFNDYITVILPDVLTLYVSSRNYEGALPELWLHSLVFLTLMIFDFFFSPLKGLQKKLLILLYFGALLCLVPYAVQMKGFFYQLIPALGFFFCAASLSLHAYVNRYLEELRNHGIILVIIIFILCYIGRPLLLSYPKHQDFADLPLSLEISQCEKPCSYFIFNDNIEIMHPTAFYNNTENASRFPAFWFLPKLIEAQYALDHNEPALLSREELAFYKEKYGRMTAEDLHRYQPKMLIIGQFILTDDEKAFDFSEFFSTESAFKTEWEHYRKERTISLNRRPYFSGTAQDEDYILTYDIYLRTFP